MTDLSYPFVISPLSQDEGGGYLVEFPDLPGCVSDGETPEEAISNGADAVQCWIAAMHAAGRQIPPPSKTAVAGRTVSIAPSIYDSLTAAARREGLDVETVIHEALLVGLVTLEASHADMPREGQLPAIRR